MPTFAYKARNEAGDPVSGTLVAETTAVVTRMLAEKSLLPIEVEQVEAAGKSLFGGSRRIALTKIGMTYEQLADLLNAGVPMLRAIKVLAKQASSPALSSVLREVHDDVAGGDALADSMEKHPNAFPKLHAAMVRAGEKGGFLEDVLTRLAEFVTRQDRLRNKFIGALIYPAILLLGALAAVSFIMAFVVPEIRIVLEGQNLPVLTRVVFVTSDALAEHYIVIIGSVLVAVTAIVGYFRSELGKTAWSRIQLRMPAFGKVYTMIALCRFCRIFGTMLANGIPILQSLHIAKDSTGNSILANAIEGAADNVRGGESLAAPLAASNVFPPAIVDMIAVAEESNTLDKVLVQIANTQEERTARQIDFVMSMLEPFLLLLIGTLIAVIAIALLVPILTMSTSGLKV